MSDSQKRRGGLPKQKNAKTPADLASILRKLDEVQDPKNADLLRKICDTIALTGPEVPIPGVLAKLVANLSKLPKKTDIPVGYAKNGRILYGPKNTKITLATGLRRFPELSEWNVWLRFEADMSGLHEWQENVTTKRDSELRQIEHEIAATKRARSLTTESSMKAALQIKLTDLFKCREAKRRAVLEFMEDVQAKRDRLIVEMEKSLQHLLKK